MATPLRFESIKLYPRLTRGRFNRWRVGFVLVTQTLYFFLPWLDWQGRQAVRFDFATMRGYLFGLTLLPQDLIYLAGTLMLCAFGLFLWTTLAGRLWCGFSCPQTVYSQIMLWIERALQGPPNARRRLDAAPWRMEKIVRKGLSQALMLLFSLWTGLTLVGYFSPMPALLTRTLAGYIGPWEAIFALGYAGFTWLLAGHLRENVCKHMCPYARFQSAMFDAETLLVSYDAARGDPRTARRKDGSAPGGACVDCGVCVQVCPTGIDIRHGLQYECIGCAACIDACDRVMDKLGQPRGLIRLAPQEMHTPLRRIWKRPRVWVYGALIGLLVAGMVIGLVQREDFRVDVLRDRAVMGRETRDGYIENLYTLRVLNTRREARTYVVRVEGAGVVYGILSRSLRVPGDGVASVTLALGVDPRELPSGSHPFTLRVSDVADPAQVVSEAGRFLLP